MDEKKIDKLLSELKIQKPAGLQMQKWKRVVRSAQIGERPNRHTFWVQLAAATIIGVIVGGLIFGQQDRADTWQDIAENDEDYATIEYIFNKTN